MKVHKQWFEKRNGKIIMPFTIHPDFPYKTKVLDAVIKMNKDLGCLKVHYIDYEDYDKNNPR